MAAPHFLSKAELESQLLKYRKARRAIRIKNVKFTVPPAVFERDLKEKSSNPKTAKFFWQRPDNPANKNASCCYVGFDSRSELKTALAELSKEKWMHHGREISEERAHKLKAQIANASTASSTSGNAQTESLADTTVPCDDTDAEIAAAGFASFSGPPGLHSLALRPAPVTQGNPTASPRAITYEDPAIAGIMALAFADRDTKAFIAGFQDTHVEPRLAVGTIAEVWPTLIPDAAASLQPAPGGRQAPTSADVIMTGVEATMKRDREEDTTEEEIAKRMKLE